MTAFALCPHDRNKDFRAIHNAHQINVDNPVPILRSHVLDRTPNANTGIVANHMDFSILIKRFLCSTFNRGARRHIALNTDRFDLPGMQIGQSNFDRLGINIGHNNVHASSAKRTCHRQSDATCTAGYKGRPTFQLFHQAAFCLYVSRASNAASNFLPSSFDNNRSLIAS